MQSGIVERIRQLHADIEQHRSEITHQMLVVPKNFRHELLIGHFIYNKAKLIAMKSYELLTLYEDEDFAAAQAQTFSPSDAVREFEGVVATRREYHRSYPQPPVRFRLDEPSLDQPLVDFASDERHGRCLALRDHYNRYISFCDEAAIKQSRGSVNPQLRYVESRTSFEAFVQQLPTLLQSIPCAKKVAALDSYTNFVTMLQEYLSDFFFRIRPLHRTQAKALLRSTISDFSTAWDRGTVPGWEPGSTTLPGSRQCALAENVCERYLALLSDVLTRTAQFCKEQPLKAVEEIEMQMEEEEAKLRAEYEEALTQYHGAIGAAHDASEILLAEAQQGLSEDNALSDARKFNKKNFPLDEFGKPIPVWLYHLHGLHLKYFCEICSHTYYGEKNYTQHFTDPRHMQGLKAIGIPDCLEELRLVSERAIALQIYAKARKRASEVIYSRKAHQTEDAMGNVSTS